MDVKVVLETWMKENGYDGLVSDCEECACKIGDLAPCDNSFLDCKPGYEIPCTCGEGCSFHITTVRPTKDALDFPSVVVNHCKPVNGIHAPFCTGHETAKQ